MASLQFFHLLLLLLLPFTLLHLVNTDGINSISDVCNQTYYPDLCHSTLVSNPASETADINSLAAISIKAALASATDTSSRISAMLKETTDSNMQQCLNDCSEHYSDVIDQLNDSLSALAERSYSDVSTWVTAAMSDTETCEAGFKESNVDTPPLTDRNADFFKLCSNSLGIINLLS